MNADIIKVRFARKPTDFKDIKLSADTEISTIRIAEKIELTAEEYDAFVSCPFAPRSWLSGKGGDLHGIRTAIQLTAPGRLTLFVDPSGYDYGRYVGLAVEQA